MDKRKIYIHKIKEKESKIRNTHKENKDLKIFQETYSEKSGFIPHKLQLVDLYE